MNANKLTRYRLPYGALLKPAYIAVSICSSILLALGLLGSMLPVELTQQWMGGLAGPVRENAALLFVLGMLLGAANFVASLASARKSKR